ncbi:RyR domain-containing protein [Novosphingobium colocasiae]|uniref:RyR domain-containing protein n=1 Tax=Novosphingobium colocasiae TaxID=1256513 RepID=UPI0035B22857
MAARAPDAGRSWRWPATRAWLALRAPLRLPLIRQRGDHLVIVGSGMLARLIVRAELAAGGSVVLWADRADPAWAHAAAGAGAAVVPLDDAEHTVTRLGLDRARAVLLLSDDDDRDIDLAGLVLAQAARSRPAGDPLAVIAGASGEPARERLRALAADVPRAIASARAITLDDLAARQVFIDHPLDRFRRHGRKERVVFLLGGSAALLRYARRMAAGGHFRDGVRPRLILAGSIEGDAAVPPGALVETLPEGAEGFAQLIARHGDPVLVAIDCAKASDAMALAHAVTEHYRAADRPAPPVLARVAEAEAEGQWPDSAMLRRFGTLEQFAGPDMLLQERHDALARSIHEFYLEGRLTDGERIGSRASLEEWDDLPEGFRDDNRLVADCYELKLRDLGARVIEAAGTPLQLGPGELEDMARAEHERWMAAKLAGGWSYAATRDDGQRLHPDIVPYDALHERIKDLDREQVRVMLRLLARSGRCPRRALLIAIEPDADPVTSAAAAAIDQAIAAILAHYPDRVPILSGHLGDAGARALLAAHSGAVRVIVTGNADRLLSGMPADEAQAAHALLVRADSVIGVDPPVDPLTVLRAGAELAIVIGAAQTPLPAVRIEARSGKVSTPWS